MEKIEYQFIGDDPELQREAVDVLARCFEVWAERKIAYKGRFPFREYSFLARTSSGEAVGHLGIIPFDVQDGSGSFIAMAGVASVAVLPQWRMHGIAGGLCHEASSWAEKKGFAAMPLYTSKIRVYEKNGWQIIPPGAKYLSAPQPVQDDDSWRSGGSLSDEERSFIIECREKSAPLAGVVKRTFDACDAVSWQRLFSKPDHLWLLTGNGYYLKVDGVLAEGSADVPLPPGVDRAFLSENDPLYSKLISAGWCENGTDEHFPPCWEGETVMLKVLNGPIPPLHYPLANKF